MASPENSNNLNQKTYRGAQTKMKVTEIGFLEGFHFPKPIGDHHDH
jgi:hypothetical protein